VNDSRPKNLNLFTISFPIPAIVSILHRITGVALFLLIPVVLWLLDISLTPEGFASIQAWHSLLYIKLLSLCLLIPLLFHLVAGIRHLLSDIHIGDTLQAARLIAKATFVITFVLLILAGIWLW
jgi:succinate dehydrogenase / fumarate reductase, cytochrome b subunit